MSFIRLTTVWLLEKFAPCDTCDLLRMPQRMQKPERTVLASLDLTIASSSSDKGVGISVPLICFAGVQLHVILVGSCGPMYVFPQLRH